MTFETFLCTLPEIKTIRPAGLSAQSLMIPEERRHFLEVEEVRNAKTREAGVMMLIYPKNGEAHLLLIERADYVGVHAKQIGFPGGKYEEIDTTLEFTALREMEEEVGVRAAFVEVLQRFTPVFVPPSNFIVVPYLGVCTSDVCFVPDRREVADLIEIPLSFLLDQELTQEFNVQTSYAEEINVPAIMYKEHIIWGATAMMLSELIISLKSLACFSK